MNSEAEETRYEDVEPHGDVKAEQRLPGKASAANLGQDVHQATSGSLPVPTLVEPDAPPSPGVEPDEYPRRESLESTTGRLYQQPTPKLANLFTSVKGNAAKILPALGARGKSLANFESPSEDAQGNDLQQESATMANGVVRHGVKFDQSYSPKTPPFLADASKIAALEDKQVLSVTIQLGTAEILSLEYIHPVTKAEKFNMTENEDFKTIWVPQINAYFNKYYVMDEVTEVSVHDITFEIAGREQPVSKREAAIYSRRKRFERILKLYKDDMEQSNHNVPTVTKWLSLQANKLVLYYFLTYFAQQDEEITIITDDGNLSVTQLQQNPDKHVVEDTAQNDWHTGITAGH